MVAASNAGARKSTSSGTRSATRPTRASGPCSPCSAAGSAPLDRSAPKDLEQRRDDLRRRAKSTGQPRGQHLGRVEGAEQPTRRGLVDRDTRRHSERDGAVKGSSEALATAAGIEDPRPIGGHESARIVLRHIRQEGEDRVGERQGLLGAYGVEQGVDDVGGHENGSGVPRRPARHDFEVVQRPAARAPPLVDV